MDQTPLEVAISHVTASYMVGGSEMYVWALARFLIRRGHRARILAGHGGRVEHYYTDVPLEIFPFRRREQFPDLGKRFRKLMERLSFGWNTRHALMERPCEILNVHKPYDLPVAIWLKKRTGCKVVWRCHGRDYFATLGYWLKQVDAIYCVSDFARNDLLAHYKVPAEVIYTGVDTKFFKPNPETRRESPPKILYFGRLEGWKGVRYLVEALQTLTDVTFQARIVGDGPERDKLAEMLLDPRLTGKATISPAVRSREGVRDLLEQADIVVLPPVAVETMSNAMLEAMAMGKAILATNVGCFPEVLRHGKTAFLVEPRSAAELAQGLRTLVAEPARRLALGEAARVEARDRFDSGQSFERVENLFLRIRARPAVG